MTTSQRIAIDGRKIKDFGIGTYIRCLVEGLARVDEDHEYVIFISDPDDANWDLPPNFEFVVDRSPGYSVRELITLSWKLYRHKVDLFHATHYVLPALIPSRSVVTIHDVIHLLYPNFLPNRLALVYAHRMIRRSLFRSDQVISVSRNTKNDLMEYFEVESWKLEVVHNGVDEVYRQELSDEEKRRWRRTLELPERYLLFVGNPQKAHKNLDRVVQAYAKARAEHDFDGPLVCVGAREGSDFKLQQRAQQLGIGEHLRLLGHVASEALPAIYQCSTLFLYPTLYEGFGLPVVEAMASGVPVITSNTSALREIAEGYAHLVSPLDIDEIAAAIGHCMTDREHRDALAKLGKRRAQDFSWDKTARKTLEVYEQVLHRAPEEVALALLFGRFRARDTLEPNSP